jgi:hypothetical protein
MFDIFGNPIFYDKFDLPMVYISVIPNVNQTYIIFSWFKVNNYVYGFFGEQLKIAPTRLTLKYLNNLIPLNCENMTVSPLLWNKWDASAKEDFLKVENDHLQYECAKNVSNGIELLSKMDYESRFKGVKSRSREKIWGKTQ